jgi:EAL domain-containing protein (putative c-di-GMP-specific phosphodiesterase class I)
MRTLRIQTDLRQALDNGELYLQYQPKFFSADRRLIGAEALIRWTHAELGQIGPSEFIPVAERSGLILEIGEWVIREVCRQLVAWIEKGIEPVKIAVNLSAKHLRQRNLAEQLAALVEEYGLSPQLLMLEITESAAMEDAEANVVTINQLQSMGFDVAIDDFGTGYSSLSYLQQFRVHQLKIDRFFIDGLDKNKDEGPAIVSAVIALAHSLHMEVVAEGVETDSQLQKLRRLSCDQIQGYLLGKPLPVEEFAALLSSKRDEEPGTLQYSI